MREGEPGLGVGEEAECQHGGGGGSSVGSQGTLAHLWDQCQDLACPEVWLGGRGMEGVSWPQKSNPLALWARSISLAG